MTAYDNLQTLNDYIRWTTSCLNASDVYFGHGSDNAFTEARSLVLSAVHLPFDVPESYLQARLTSDEQHKITDWLHQRIENKIPLAYLRQSMEFAGLSFYIDNRVLVPRSPFAELIDQRFAPWWPSDAEPNQILDLCAGSGCIGIAAGLEMDVPVTLSDISAAALEVAAINAGKYAEAIDIELIQSDLFAEIHAKYDLILTNPPYVDADEIHAMPAEFQHEPILGLESGDDGLHHIRQILQDAPNYLTDEGILFAEIGASAHAMMDSYPDFPGVWIEFSMGGSGVFVINRASLLAWLESRPFH